MHVELSSVLFEGFANSAEFDRYPNLKDLTLKTYIQPPKGAEHYGR